MLRDLWHIISYAYGITDIIAGFIFMAGVRVK